MSKEQQPALTEGVYYILISLYHPLHGYGIMQKVEEMTKSRVRLSPGTLYGALRTLLERGWIEVYAHDKDSGKKEYIITEEGRETVIEEVLRLKELLANGEDIVGGTGS